MDDKPRKGRRGEAESSVPRTLVVIGFASFGIVDFRGEVLFYERGGGVQKKAAGRVNAAFPVIYEE